MSPTEGDIGQLFEPPPPTTTATTTMTDTNQNQPDNIPSKLQTSTATTTIGTTIAAVPEQIITEQVISIIESEQSNPTSNNPSSTTTISPTIDIAITTAATITTSTDTATTTIVASTCANETQSTNTEITIDVPGTSTLSQSLDLTETATGLSKGTTCDFRDNGIFDFMSPERAIELYKKIHANGGAPLELEWKFYGRRKLKDNQEAKDSNDNNQCDNGNDSKIGHPQLDNQDSLLNTEFDFDDSLAEMETYASTIINDSLQLKKRPEQSVEKRTNLSDIMSDIFKVTNNKEIE